MPSKVLSAHFFFKRVKAYVYPCLKENAVIYEKIQVLFLVFLALCSCSKDDEVSSNANNNTPAQTVSDADFALQNFGSALTTNFSGTIKDATGNPVNEVQIAIGSATAITDENGVFTIANANVNENFAYIKATKTGYIPASRSVVPLQTSTNQINITLLAQETVATISSGEASEVSLPNGATVNFEGGFITENGDAYTGAVAVSVHYLAPNQDETFTQMPGMLFGKRTDGSPTGMETYGMLAVNLYGANGEVLNIDENTPATLTLPVDASTPNAPESMPLWYFDEVTGYWKEEGVATKVGSNYVAEVTHFTWWNVDFPLDTVNACFSLSATNALSNFYFKIIRNETNQTVYSGYTNEIGTTCGLFPKDEGLTINVYGNSACSNGSNEVIYTQNIGPYSNDFTTNYTIGLPTGYAESTLSATVTDCDGDSITNGYAVIGNNVNNQTQFVTITNGTINYNLTYCSSNYYIQVYDATNQVNSNEISLTLSETTTNLGTLSACGIDTIYQIGDFYLGGIIFDIYEPGDVGYVAGETHGLIAATSDQSTGIQWALPAFSNVTVPGVGATSNTDGASNTDAIIAQTGAASANTYAAGLCRLYSTSGNNDQGLWYLPAKDELNLMYENIGEGNALGLGNIGSFASDFYWSSTEGNTNYAWYQDFFYGNQSNYFKNDSHFVRAVRAF
jgi:hypothetical protein